MTQGIQMCGVRRARVLGEESLGKEEGILIGRVVYMVMYYLAQEAGDCSRIWRHLGCRRPEDAVLVTPDAICVTMDLPSCRGHGMIDVEFRRSVKVEKVSQRHYNDLQCCLWKINR